MVRESCCISTKESTKATGRTIIETAKGFKNLVTVQFTRETMLRVSLMAVVDISGKTDSYTKESGRQDSNMVLEYGEGQRETRI